MRNQSLAWLIIWLPFLGFLFNAFLGKKLGKRAVAVVAPAVVLAAFVVSMMTLWNEVLTAPEHRLLVPLIPGMAADTPWIRFGGFQVNFGLLLDPLSMLMALIVTGVGGLIHVYATGYMADDPEQPRFFTYFNLFIVMMLLLVLGENFLLLFVGWEGVGTCSYLLISFWYTRTENAQAGNKAFIVNRVGDLGFALGMMAIWSVFGTLSYFGSGEHAQGVMDLAKAHIDGNGQPLAHLPTLLGMPMLSAICILLFVGAMGKSAQIPLWVWLPDAMAGPTPVSALIHAATMVTAGVVMVTRCSWLFVQAPEAMKLVGWVGLATAFMGATIGLVQNDIKRVLAFSTISQLGYMFLACGVGAFTAGMFHVTTHAFFKALLFLGSGAVIHSMLGEQDMRRMGGLKTKIGRTWMLMAVGTYAIAGVPLLSGFWSKDEILDHALESPWGSGVLLYVVGLGTAFMTAFYMNRMMWKTFDTDARFTDGQLTPHHHGNFSDEKAHGTESHGDAHAAAPGHHEEAHAPGTGSVHESPASMMLPLYVLAALSLLFGLVMGPLLGGRFEKFLEPSVAPLSLGPLHAHTGHVFAPWVGYLISSIIAFAGLAFAHARYSAHRPTGELIPAAEKTRLERHPFALYTFLLHKWWWDAVYNFVFIRVGGWIADRILWRTVDAGMVDGLFVRVVGGGVYGISSVFRRLQTGYVRNYALGMLFGVVILILFLLRSWKSIVP